MSDPASSPRERLRQAVDRAAHLLPIQGTKALSASLSITIRCTPSSILFTRLFLGKRPTGFTVMADAGPRERWILTAAVLFVVVSGLFPNAIVARRTAAAHTDEQALRAPLRGPVAR